jgi:hypothetical protein
VRRWAGTQSSVRSTASCPAAHAASGHAAVVGAVRCSRRNTVARANGVTGSPPSTGTPRSLLATASPAADAASVSSELRSRARADRSEKPVTAAATARRTRRIGVPP